MFCSRFFRPYIRDLSVLRWSRLSAGTNILRSVFWMQFFLLTVGSFLLTVELFYLQLTFLASLLTVGAFWLTILAFSAYNWSFLAYSGKVCLTRALRHCKQRSLTVSKKTPTVSKKTSPVPLGTNLQDGSAAHGPHQPTVFVHLMFLFSVRS